MPLHVRVDDFLPLRSMVQAAGDVKLRVLKRGTKNRMEVNEVHVPAEDTLAQHVIKMDKTAAEERARLKRQILLHEHY